MRLHLSVYPLLILAHIVLFPPLKNLGAERANMGRLHEGVGRGAKASVEGQCVVHLPSRDCGHSYRHRGGGLVNYRRDSIQVHFLVPPFLC